MSLARKFDGPLGAVVPDQAVRQNIILQRLKCCFATLCLLMGGLLPLGAVAQVTEPLLPNAVPPSAPQVLAPPGEEPVYAGQTVTSRLRREFDPVGLRLGDFFWFPRGELDE